MFKLFFISELRYTLRQPMVYIFTGIVTLLVFAAASSDAVQIGGAVGNVYRNAPSVITVYVSVLTIFGLLFAAAFFNNAALREHKNNFNEILFSSPVSKAGFFMGRFFGALLISTLPLLGVYIGIFYGSLIAPAMGWIEPDRIGPFYAKTFINTYLLFILPNMFIAGSIIFGLAQRFKNTMISFVGAMIIIVGYIASGQLLSDIDNETIAALSDPFAIRTYGLTSKYYTPLEKNTLSPSFSGLMLYNRMIWVGVGLGILLFSYVRFSFQERKKKGKSTTENQAAKPIEVLPTPQVFFSPSAGLQFWSFFKTNFINIFRHVTFQILFVFSLILLLTSFIGGYEYFGLQSYPQTYKVVETITTSTALFVSIIIIFFSGELIWRDRDVHINEVIDATPHFSMVPLLAKTTSLIALTFVMQLLFIGIGIVYQLSQGFYDIELGVYIGYFLLSVAPINIVTALFVVAIQVLVNHKYLGYFVSLLVILVLDIIMLIAEISSNMLSFAGGPFIVYSDMNGFGPAVGGKLWFNTYWILMGISLLLVSGWFWTRGNTSGIGDRFQNLKRNTTPIFRIVTLSILGLWGGVAGWVYYNTEVLNTRVASKVAEQRAVDYENKYKKYADMIHPKVVDAQYKIDLFPEDRKLLSQVDMVWVNTTGQTIDSIHYNVNDVWDQELKMEGLKEVYFDEELNYKIFQLDPPMAPGDSIEVVFTTKILPQGFTNGTGNTSFVANGSFFNNFSLLPNIGYSAGRELGDKNTRKKYGLGPKKRTPDLEENCGPACEKNYLTDGYSDFMPFETVISTSTDQIAIAPGSLLKSWEEGDRKYYHYKVDHPSQHFVSFMSARYKVAQRDWKGVSLEVYYDPKHDVNIEMMLDAMERSLAYYTKNFGPYMHKQCRIIEFPRYATFAQAFPGTMPYSESFGFITNLEDASKNNVVDAVIAHEIAHQWWAHQVIGAQMQGGTMLSESFSEYSSLMTMKSIAETPMKMREFIKYDHDRYLSGRSQEIEKELPLYKVENQSYLHYGKGSVILYALQDYIGEDKVNAAMKSFLEQTKYRTPYPTSLDFLEHLEEQTPDSLNYLIDDWFKKITLYDNRLSAVEATKRSDGKYDVTLSIEAKKVQADSIGKETEVPLKEWIDVGLFADEDEEELMIQKRIPFQQNSFQYTFITDSLPQKAAIDPRHLLIDRIYSDNIKTVSLKE